MLAASNRCREALLVPSRLIGVLNLACCCLMAGGFKHLRPHETVSSSDRVGLPALRLAGGFASPRMIRLVI